MGGKEKFSKMSSRVSELPRTYDVVFAEGDVWPVAPAVCPQPKPVALDLACATSDRSDCLKQRAYRVTISVKGDICDGLVRWIQRTYDEYNKYIVCERGQNGQRHLHMLIEFKEKREKRNVRKPIMDKVKKFHPEIHSKAVVVNTAYDMSWYDEYLRKEEDCENVDTDNFDAESFRLALPDQATQNALQDAQRRKPIGAYWIDHEKRWIERYPDDASYESASLGFRV